MTPTFEQELAKAKESKNPIRIRLTFVDVPIHLANAFCSDVKDNYGNIYWVKLMDLMRKAEAYDAFIALADSPSQPIIPESKDEEKPHDKYGEIKTMGGLRP